MKWWDHHHRNRLVKVAWDAETVTGSIDASRCSIEAMCLLIHGGIECYAGREINFTFSNHLAFRFFPQIVTIIPISCTTRTVTTPQRIRFVFPNGLMLSIHWDYCWVAMDNCRLRNVRFQKRRCKLSWILLFGYEDHLLLSISAWEYQCRNLKVPSPTEMPLSWLNWQFCPPSQKVVIFFTPTLILTPFLLDQLVQIVPRPACSSITSSVLSKSI